MSATCALYITLWVSTILNVCLLGYVILLDRRCPWPHVSDQRMPADDMSDRLTPDQIYSSPYKGVRNAKRKAPKAK